MDENFNIQAYMTRGVERIAADSLKAALGDPRESALMLKFAAASRKASKLRAEVISADFPDSLAGRCRRGDNNTENVVSLSIRSFLHPPDGASPGYSL
ncbi:MAG: hypothetical protein NC341_09615 [Blautia sp.]|nr:hypothetical protein [Blautia sp.]MCM1201404.1 hypothetical protein [Bacteroides fragilis]